MNLARLKHDLAHVSFYLHSVEKALRKPIKESPTPERNDLYRRITESIRHLVLLEKRLGTPALQHLGTYAYLKAIDVTLHLYHEKGGEVFGRPLATIPPEIAPSVGRLGAWTEYHGNLDPRYRMGAPLPQPASMEFGPFQLPDHSGKSAETSEEMALRAAQLFFSERASEYFDACRAARSAKGVPREVRISLEGDTLRTETAYRKARETYIDKMRAARGPDAATALRAQLVAAEHIMLSAIESEFAPKSLWSKAPKGGRGKNDPITTALALALFATVAGDVALVASTYEAPPRTERESFAAYLQRTGGVAEERRWGPRPRHVFGLDTNASAPTQQADRAAEPPPQQEPVVVRAQEELREDNTVSLLQEVPPTEGIGGALPNESEPPPEP